MAQPFIDELSRDLGKAARSLRMGELEFAFSTLERNADRVQKFLTFLSVAVTILREAQDPLAGELDAYERRLLQVLGHVEDALRTEDFVALTLGLEHGLARVLTVYGDYAPRVRDALSPRLAA